MANLGALSLEAAGVDLASDLLAFTAITWQHQAPNSSRAALTLRVDGVLVDGGGEPQPQQVPPVLKALRGAYFAARTHAVSRARFLNEAGSLCKTQQLNGCRGGVWASSMA